MPHYVRNIGLVALVFIVTLTPFCVATGIDYIGVRLILPLGQMPPMVGVEIGSRVSFGWATASLFLTQDGRTLLLGGVEMAINDEEDPGSSLLRAVVGVSYFDLAARFPAFVVGGGITYRISINDAFQVGIRGEIIYPLALGPPLMSIGGGWAP